MKLLRFPQARCAAASSTSSGASASSRVPMAAAAASTAPKQLKAGAWKFSGTLQFDMTNVPAHARRAELGQIMQTSMARGTPPPAPTFLHILCTARDEHSAVIQGFVEAAPACAKRWESWLPRFTWKSIEGHVRDDASYLSATVTAGPSEVLHSTGEMRAQHKRVSKPC